MSLKEEAVDNNEPIKKGVLENNTPFLWIKEFCYCVEISSNVPSVPALPE